MKNVTITIIKWLAWMILAVATIAVVGTIGALIVLYGSMYMIVAMIQYGTDTVMQVVFGVFAAITALIIIRWLIKRHNRRKVYKIHGR